MTTLKIKNIGPIATASFTLNKLNVFMGPQSSGKSTIAKLVSFCTWFEKNVAINQDLNNDYSNHSTFVEKLESYHKMKGYFRPESFLKYESDVISLKYENQILEIKWKNRYAYKRSKISYIPSERNMVIMPEMEKLELPNNSVKSFLFDWFDARKQFSEDNNLDILNLGVQFYHIPDSKENHIRYINNGDSYDILLSNASSGLQSLTPLISMVDYLVNYIYEKEAKESFEQKENEIKVRHMFTRDLVCIPFFKEKKESGTSISEQVNEFNKLTSEGDQEAIDYFFKYKKACDNLFITQNSQFIIEEPEQNLFPETQRNFIYYLLNKCKSNQKDNRITITTHSPYILYSLNNCMMASKVLDKMDENSKSHLKCRNSSIDTKDVSIYEIKDGCINPIQQEDGLIGDNYFDQKMKDLMDDFYLMLNYYE